jgi:alkaline phosphatase
MGLFGDMRSALAAECGLLDGPSLEDMTTAALARLRAVERGRPAFLVVAGDRIDAAAHTGDAAAVAAGLADFAGSVRAAVVAASARSDALVIVTGDHGTVFGTAKHSSESVPILAYGGLAVPLPQDMSHRDVRDALGITKSSCAS